MIGELAAKRTLSRVVLLRFVVGVLAIFVAVRTGAADGGSLDWVHNPATGHDYALTAGMTWTQAEALAVSEGGHLAAVNDAAEQAWLVNTFLPPGSGLSTFIGLNDLANEGIWEWTTGEPVTYTNWAGGQPGGGTGENVVDMYETHGGRWHDQAESAILPGIIERSPIGCKKPKVKKLKPKKGSPGDIIRIKGKNFGATEGSVEFHDGVPATVVSWSEKKIKAEVPGGAQTGKVYVTNSCGKRSKKGRRFTVK